MKMKVVLAGGLLFGLSAITMPQQALSSSLRLNQTDELMIALKQAVQKQYRVPAHDILVLWNDAPLEQKLAKFGKGYTAEISDFELKNLIKKSVIYVKVLSSKGKYHSRIPVKVRIDAWSDAYMMADALDRGQPLRKQVVKKVRRKLSVLPLKFVRKLKYLNEYQVTRDVDVNQFLVRSMLKQRQIVLKGSQVSVLVVNQNLKLMAKGKSLGSGVRGQRVKIKILSFGSNKTVDAVVTGLNHVTLTVK